MSQHKHSELEHGEHGEHSTQTSLDSLGDMANQMGHASDTMEIIGIAAPEDAEALEQQTSNDRRVIPLPGQPPP